MSDLRVAAKQALEALCLWSAGRDMDAVALNDLIFRLRDALVEDAMQKFTDVNQELEAALAEPAPPPEAQTEEEKIAYCAGWWAAMEKIRVS